MNDTIFAERYLAECKAEVDELSLKADGLMADLQKAYEAENFRLASDVAHELSGVMHRIVSKREDVAYLTEQIAKKEV